MPQKPDDWASTIGADPRQPWRGPAVAGGLGLVVVIGLVAFTISIASRLPLEVVVGAASGSPRGADMMDVDPSLNGSFPPLDRRFVLAALGKDLSALLGLAPAPGSDGRAGEHATSAPAGPPGSSRSQPPTSTTTTTLVGPLVSPIPRFSELAVDMAADRSTVAPGEHIVYRITVTNVGTSEFRGQLRISSHHPFWTTDSSTPCGDTGVEPDPGDPCIQPPTPVPGTPDESAHTVQFSYEGSVAPGATVVREFRVRVDPGTPSGTEIRNHAHLDVVGDSAGPKTSQTVTVTVL